jgi:hypothetical protein
MDKNRALIFFVATIALLYAPLMPVGFDWNIYNVSSLAQIKAPYAMPGFVGIPFAFFVLPHSLLSVAIGNTINLWLNIIVIMLVARKYSGGWWWLVTLLAITTPIGALLIRNNNIDWIPLAAFLAPDWLAYPLWACKPQVLAGAAVIRFKRNPNLLCLVPLVLVGIASVIIWGAWWQQLGGGVEYQNWNYAPWPWLIPVGLYLLWWAWRENDEIIAASATIFFVPYFAPYSLVGLHVLIAARNKRLGFGLWVLSYWLLIISV